MLRRWNGKEHPLVGQPVDLAVMFTVSLFYPGMTPGILISEELHLALANTLSGGASISLSEG